MTPEHAVASKHWRWLPGMRDQLGRRVMWVYPDDAVITWSHTPTDRPPLRDQDALPDPDLDDPATVGCVIQLVCDAWDDPHAYLAWSSPDWKVLVQPPGHIRPGSAGHGRSKAEALVNALKAAR